jgi:hypothetical protein
MKSKMFVDRQEFETWARSEGYVYFHREMDGLYGSAVLGALWRCWVASRDNAVRKGLESADALVRALHEEKKGRSA